MRSVRGVGVCHVVGVARGSGGSTAGGVASGSP